MQITLAFLDSCATSEWTEMSRKTVYPVAGLPAFDRQGPPAREWANHQGDAIIIDNGYFSLALRRNHPADTVRRCRSYGNPSRLELRDESEIPNEQHYRQIQGQESQHERPSRGERMLRRYCIKKRDKISFRPRRCCQFRSNGQSSSSIRARITRLITRMQENMLDYVFLKLGVPTSNVEHPILMSETLANPLYSRARPSHLLSPLRSISYAFSALQ